MFKFMYCVKKRLLCRIFLNDVKRGKEMWELHSVKTFWKDKVDRAKALRKICYLSDGERRAECLELSDKEIEQANGIEKREQM